jgi:MFS family permease
VLAPYRTLFRVSGAPRLAAAAFVMRAPIAIYPIGLVLIVSARTGHYGFAGVLSGVYVIANGVGNPTLARLADRVGQRRLLVPASAVHLAAVLALAACFELRWPDWVALSLTVVAGFAYLSVGSLVRARWSYRLAGRPELSTAYSVESTLDEIIFVLGPLIATLIATQLQPELVLYLGGALVIGGAVWLAADRVTEPPRRTTGSAAPASALRTRGMPTLALYAAAMGVVFSSAEVTMVAFCGQHGHRGLSGAPLAAFAFGSAVAGFGYGARHWRADLLDRFRLQAIVFGLLTATFLLAINIPVLVACAFVAGFGIAPALITAFGLTERLVPNASLTEGLAWLITGLSVGYGAGAALVGRIADAHGARTAFLVTLGAGLTMAALGAGLHHALSGTSAMTRVESEPADV